jgi:DNA-binding response OmpR family regulator
MLVGKRLLIVEDEFLIALDIQRILEAAEASATLFARSVGEAEAQTEKFSTLDLAIIEIAGEPDRASQFAMLLLAHGVPVVFTSSSIQHREGLTDVPQAPVVIKPFAEEELLAACLAALKGKRQVDLDQ